MLAGPVLWYKRQVLLHVPTLRAQHLAGGGQSVPLPQTQASVLSCDGAGTVLSVPC